MTTGELAPVPDRPPAAGRRVAAAVALASLAGALAVAVVRVLDAPAFVAVNLVLIVVAVLTAWVALTRLHLVRLVAGAAAVAVLVALVVRLVGDGGIVTLVAVVGLVALASVSGRFALGHDVATLEALPVPGTPVPPAAHGVLLINPRSGGGKAEQCDLEGECRRRGIRPVVLGEGDDVTDLATQAVKAGADVIGMAGGDGSQALVAEVAARHGLAHVVVPAGTRNHLALDLGLDRDDVVGALDAYGAAVERRVDLGTVNGRAFVNNVSLGVYAEVVQSDEYRDAKLATVVGKLPELLGPDAPPCDLRFHLPDGTEADGAHIVQVSNNPYTVNTWAGGGTRPRLDGGTLGVVALRVDGATGAAELGALLAAGHPERYRGYHGWAPTTLRVDSGSTLPAGVDGEALQLDPPLEFGIRPRALRVRLPEHAPGYSPAALAPRSWFGVDDLVAVLRGREPRADAAGDATTA